MALKLMGKKQGMTQLFDDKGQAIVCTVISIEPNVVAQIKTEANDGYKALQLAYEKIVVKDPRRIEKLLKKPVAGHYAKREIAARRHMQESRLEDTDSYQLGQEIGVELFGDGTYVDVSSRSKGKGFQGVIKLHKMSGGPASHGSGFHRHMGSTGMRTTPGRSLPGGKRASHMGSKMTTVQNLKIFRADKENGLLLVMGPVPGAKGALVTIQVAKKKKQK